MTGRQYDPSERLAIIERIAARIEDGSLNEEAAVAEGISEDTRRRWCREDPALDAVHTRARTIGAHALAEEAVRIAAGKPAQDGTRYADAQERRLAYDALRWLAGKRRPREYGDRVEHAVTGSVQVQHLDALRAPRVSAKATLANPMPIEEIALLTSPIGRPEGEANRTDAEGPPDSVGDRGVV